MTIAEALQIGRGHHQAGRLAQAESIYRTVLAQEPRFPEALHLLGVVAQQTGQPAAARQLIAQALERQPEWAEAWTHLAHTLLELADGPGAVEAARTALRLQPESAAAHHLLGLALLAAGRVVEARGYFKVALQRQPDFPEARFGLGRSFEEAGDLREAIPHYEAVGALARLGPALVNVGRAPDAERCLREFLRGQPEDLPAAVNLGYALTAQEKWAEARAAFESVLARTPGYAPAFDGLGAWCAAQGLYPEALEWHERAIAGDPANPQSRWNRALLRLLTGNFAAGWEDYEARWQCSFTLRTRRAFSAPLWNGESLEGRTILLHAEQGRGDALQMARYVPLVAERGGRVLLEGPVDLAPLLRALPGVQAWRAAGEELPPFNLHCPLMSLPRAFGTMPEGIPAPRRYLTAPEERRAAWRKRLGAGGPRTIGLVWAGRGTHREDRQRSLALEFFAPLLARPGLRWVSLQKGPAAEQARTFPALEDWTDALHDFGETAALIENLDLVIGVDTAVIHLAGALGQPVWTLLPFAPDWRWGPHGERSAWYPTMRLFRQRALNDWPRVLAEVEAALAEVAP